jgi:hypothetical protein
MSRASAASAASAAVPVEVVVIMGTHGGLRAKPVIHHEPRHGEFDFLFPVTWPRADVEICGITMPFGGNVNYADDERETQALDAAAGHLKMSGTFFDNNNLKLRRLADALLDSDTYLPVVCVNGSQDQFSAPKIHKDETLESDYDNEVSSTMEGVTGFDVVKGCVSKKGTLDKRQIIANYVPVVYSNTGNIEQTATGLTKVPLCSKVFTLSSQEYREGRGHDTDPEKRPTAEWKVTLLIKYSDDRVDRIDQFAEQLLREQPPHVFGDAQSIHLRPDEHSKAFYTETLISYLISKGYLKITIVDVTCNVFRNSGPYRPGGYPFGPVCEGGMTPNTLAMLHRTVTPWIMLSQFGILETYDRATQYPEADGYYRDRFRNATPNAVRYLINTYYDYLQLIYECKEVVLQAFVHQHKDKLRKQALKETNPAKKIACIQDFFDLYKRRSLAIRGTAIVKPNPSSKGGKSHKTRHGKRHKSRNFRNKSRFRRTRRRVIKEKINNK